MIDATTLLAYCCAMWKPLMVIVVALLVITVAFALFVLWAHFMAEEMMQGFDDDCSTDNPDRNPEL